MPIIQLARPLPLLHWGSWSFSPTRFRPISDPPIQYRPKPLGGLWTSPIDSSFGWREYLAQYQPGWWTGPEATPYFNGELLVGATVLVVDGKDDLDLLSWSRRDLGDPATGPFFPQFEPLAHHPTHPIHAIHLTTRGLAETSDITEPRHLAMWDCETVLVMRAEAFRAERVGDWPFGFLEEDGGARMHPRSQQQGPIRGSRPRPLAALIADE